jgi:hypothetical protein
VRLPAIEHILDEFRVFDDSGHTVFVSTTIRAYDALRDRWELVSVDDRATGLQNWAMVRNTPRAPMMRCPAAPRSPPMAEG